MITFGKDQKAGSATKSTQELDLQRIVCVAAIFTIASLPLVLSVALAIWGA